MPSIIAAEVSSIAELNAAIITADGEGSFEIDLKAGARSSRQLDKPQLLLRRRNHVGGTAPAHLPFHLC